MFDKSLKFNTVQGERPAIITKCKLLFTNMPYNLRSVDLLCDGIAIDFSYILVRSFRLSLFDARLLPILRLADSECSASAAIAYSYDGDVCRFISSGEYSASAYAAPVTALFYKGEIGVDKAVVSASPIGKRSVTVTEGGILVF